MLKRIIKYRPTNLYAVYVESHGVEVLRAKRRWRTWEIEPAEKYHVPEGESVIDFLQTLNLRPRTKKASALLLLLPCSFYSVHREHYPLSLKDQLEETMNFDWQENTFQESDRSFNFFGPPNSLKHSISVPIFSIQREVYDKFHQALNGSYFHTFTVKPTALSYSTFLDSLTSAEVEEPLEIMARIVDDSSMEVHRFYHGEYLDSMMVDKSSHALKMFRENLAGLGGDDDEPSVEPHIHLLCLSDEGPRVQKSLAQWTDEGLPIQVNTLNDSFVTSWVRQLLQCESVYTFDTELLLKPWQVPKVAWAIMIVAFLFSVHALYQVHAVSNLTKANKRAKIEVSQLETRWKPVEELQSRISKFSEDKKTLSEFDKEGYPLLELLSFLTQATPNDTWLNYLSLRKGELILRGESKSAIKYLSELSKTEGFTDVKFASPVTRNPTSDDERFNVQLMLETVKLHKSFEAMPAETDDSGTPATVPVAAQADPNAPGVAQAVEAPPEGVLSEEPPPQPAQEETAQ